MSVYFEYSVCIKVSLEVLSNGLHKSITVLVVDVDRWKEMFTHIFSILSFSLSIHNRYEVKCDKHTMNKMNALLTGYHDYYIVQLEVFLLLQRFGQMNYYFASCSNRTSKTDGV